RVVLGLEGTVAQVAYETAAAGIADVHRLAFQPEDPAVGDRLQVPSAALDDSFAHRKRHLRVVGDLTGLELEPAAAHKVLVDSVLSADFACGEKLHSRTERVADRQSEV